MKLPKEEIEAREDYVRKLFIAHPDMSGPEATQKVEEQFGAMMRVHRIYQIRFIVHYQLEKGKRGSQIKLDDEEAVAAEKAERSKRNSNYVNTVVAARTAEMAARGGVTPMTKGGVTLVKVRPGVEGDVEEVLTFLHKEGAFAGKVSHKGEGYLVIDF